jgi:hypothetical protein
MVSMVRSFPASQATAAYDMVSRHLERAVPRKVPSPGDSSSVSRPGNGSEKMVYPQICGSASASAPSRGLRFEAGRTGLEQKGTEAGGSWERSWGG